MSNDGELDQRIAPLVQLAEADLHASGGSSDLADLSEDDWQALLGRIATRAQENALALPAGWQEALARYRDRQRLQADIDDTRLAEQGEVFGREDDA